MLRRNAGTQVIYRRSGGDERCTRLTHVKLLINLDTINGKEQTSDMHRRALHAKPAVLDQKGGFLLTHLELTPSGIQ